MLKKQSRMHEIRWSRPENLHITLQFLAETHSEHLQTLIKNVRDSMEGAVKRIPLSFGTLQLFPNPYRPRVIVLEVLPQEEWANLSRLIGEGLKASNYALETRPFRAHLTLGRIKQPQNAHLHFLSECAVPEFEKIMVDEVVLFRSEPQPEGSKYSIMERLKVE